MRAVLAGVGIAFADTIVSFVIGMFAGFTGSSVSLYPYGLSLLFCFAVFFIGGRYIGPGIFWPAAIAYIFLAACSAFAVATIASESVVAYGSRMAPLLFLEFALAIIAFWVGVWSRSEQTQVVKSAP